MAPKTSPKSSAMDREEPIEGEDQFSQELKELILSLPRENVGASLNICLYESVWYPSYRIQGVINYKKHFQVKESDVIVATNPKSGTTWLKALTFAILNRHNFTSLLNHPLLTSNPHDLVLFLEDIFDVGSHGKVPDLSNMPEPRLFGTHVPFSSLPNSTKESNCKIIYICRNPFDTFISLWTFLNKIMFDSFPLEETFEMYCKGKIVYGPFWNHMLDYWKESIASPNRVLFLKYEDLKEDINLHVRRIAEFLGCPFTLEEESSGVIENIINLSSFEKMKQLEVNKIGMTKSNLQTKHYVWKGEIGDWKNYFCITDS